MNSAWLYIIRFTLASYYLFNHLTPLLQGFKKINSNSTIFACTGDLLPPVVAFNIWNGAFVLLAALILLWPRPVTFLFISLFVLLLEAYITFGSNAIYGTTSLLLSICILINIVLLILYGRLRY